MVLILALVLFTPFGVSADYSAGDVRVSARVMSFNLPLYPKPERPKKEKKAAKPKKEKKKAPEAEAKSAKPKKEKPPLVTKDMVPDLLRLLGRTLSRFRRKLTVNRFMLHVTIAGEDDPDDAVMTYGVVNSTVATVGSAAGRLFNVRRSDVQTGMDFSAAKTQVEFGLTVTLNAARILAVALVAGIGFIKIKRKAAKAQNAAAKERKEKEGTNADPDGGISQGEHS